MADNVYKFLKAKWASPKPPEMTDGFSGSRYFSGLIVVCVLIGFVAVQGWMKFSHEPKITIADKSVTFASALTSISVRVIDGDTISLDDGRPNVRLVGFNTPETGNRARCEAERQKGEAAKQRLRELVGRGRSDFQQIACSCAPGTEGTDACNFGRRCGTLRVNGVDVAATLVGEGLAVRFVCGAKLSDAPSPLVLTQKPS